MCINIPSLKSKVFWPSNYKIIWKKLAWQVQPISYMNLWIFMRSIIIRSLLCLPDWFLYVKHSESRTDLQTFRVGSQAPATGPGGRSSLRCEELLQSGATKGHSLLHETGGMSVTWQNDLRVEATAALTPSHMFPLRVGGFAPWWPAQHPWADEGGQEAMFARTVNNHARKRW